MRAIGVLLLLVTWPVVAVGQAPVPGAGELPAGSFLDRHFDLHGYLRVRFDVLDNFDLNVGPTPTTGQPIFPIPASDPRGSTLAGGNMRLRLDPTIRVGWGVSLHARIDILDNIVLGSTPDGLPSNVWYPMSGGSTMMAPPSEGKNSYADSVRAKRAWGEVLLPIGVLSAGRMGALIDWGTGFFINSGSCLDCDLGDVGDRIAFTLPLVGHLFTFAFDFGASGPTSATLRADPQPFDLDRRDDVRSYALVFARYDTPLVVERYRAAGRTVVQYGVLAAFRTQDYDLPTYYLTGDRSRSYGPSDLVRRGLFAFASDLWFGLRRGPLTLDVEAALVLGQIDNVSLQPGTEMVQRTTSRQLGGVARARLDWPRLQVGLELGLASGDSAPGFGVRPPLNQYSAQPGDLEGPQLRLPGDTTVDNFRFNPDYHIDLILWRHLIGTVSDAFYARPSARWQPLRGSLAGPGADRLLRHGGHLHPLRRAAAGSRARHLAHLQRRAGLRLPAGVRGALPALRLPKRHPWPRARARPHHAPAPRLPAMSEKRGLVTRARCTFVAHHRALGAALVLIPCLCGCPGPNPILADGGDLQRTADALACQPNNDGIIALSELAFAPGLAASYRVNPPGTLVDVDVAGTLVDGKLQWDFTSVASSSVVTIPVEAVTSGLWYAKHFPTASFAVGSDASGETLQIFRLEGSSLLLLGIASRRPDWTLLVYDQPVTSLRFPLEVGAVVSSKASANNGKLNGLPVATEDTYEVRVDAVGNVRLPFLTLQNSLRVLVSVTSRAVGGASATTRQAQWFHECYGEVARAISQRDESSAVFTRAVELRRLSF